MASGYGDKAYWDKRYSAQEDKYDWYLSYSQFRDQIVDVLNVLNKDGKEPQELTGGDLYETNKKRSTDRKRRLRSDLQVCVVGCGNSDMSLAFYEDGFTNIISIDYSEIVINKMKELHKDMKSLVYEVQDVRQMTYTDGYFDVIVDKGTLDAILCGSDSATNANGMLSECQRVLKKGGYFFVITYGQPSSRLNYLEKTKYQWKVSYQLLGKTRYMYTMYKNL